MKSMLYGPKKELNRARGRTNDGELRQKFYRSRRWFELKNKHLTAQPYCEKCLEEYGEWNRRNVVVDHIYGHNDNGWLQRFWDPACLQTLCKRHHDKKTAKEKGDVGFLKKPKSRMTATQRLAIRRKLRETT